MEMACGGQAMKILNETYAQNKLVSQAFSAKLSETGAAAQRMNEQLANVKFQLTGLQRKLFAQAAKGYLCGCYFTAIFMLSLPILATTIEPDCAAKDVVPLMAVAEPRALPSMP